MEEAPVTALQFFAGLILPVSLVAIVLGLFATAVGAFAAARPRRALAQSESENSGAGVPQGLISEPQSSAVERIAVGIFAAMSLLAVVVAIRSTNGSRFPSVPIVSILLFVALLSLALPAILWKTRLRFVGEGLALIAVAAVAILGVWSIGVFVLPLVVLMMWTCLQHLRRAVDSSL
jgi:hypothetical protein